MADQQLQDAYDKAKRKSHNDFGFVWASLLKSNVLNCTNVWEIFKPRFDTRYWSDEQVIAKVEYLTLLPDWPSDIIGATRFIHYCNDSGISINDLLLLRQQLVYSTPTKEDLIECLNLTADSTRPEMLVDYLIQAIKVGSGNKKLSSNVLETLVKKEHPLLSSYKIWALIKKDSITTELFNYIHAKKTPSNIQRYALTHAIENSPLNFIKRWMTEYKDKGMEPYIAESITGNTQYISPLGKGPQYAICNLLPAGSALELAATLNLNVADLRFETNRRTWQWSLPVLHEFIKQTNVLPPAFVITESHKIFDVWLAQSSDRLRLTKLAFINRHCSDILALTPTSKDNLQLLKKEILALLLITGVPELNIATKEKLKKVLGHDIRTPTGETQIIKKVYPDLKGVLNLIKSVGLDEIDAWNYYAQQRMAPFRVAEPTVDTSVFSTLTPELI